MADTAFGEPAAESVVSISWGDGLKTLEAEIEITESDDAHTLQVGELGVLMSL